MKNRLRLDFSLETAEERSNFINKYLNEEPFLTKPPTSSELEKIADYLLWGKDEEGKASNADGALELKSAYSSKPILSLDELMESPAFNESQLSSLGAVPTRTSKKTFSRELARRDAPPHILVLLEALWREIDALDLETALYEVRIEKKEKVRDELLTRFSPSEVEALTASAETLPQYTYLRKKKLLVEKRREQFTLQDTYQTKLCRFIPHVYNAPEVSVFDADISVLPAGLLGKSKLSAEIFPEEGLPLPSNLSDDGARALSELLWRPTSKRFFDFRELSHLQELMKLWDTLQEGLDDLPLESTLGQLFKTLDWYRQRAGLTDLESEVLDLKLAHHQNQPIAEHINEKYGKTYNPNYISTIYNQKALLKICETARTHRDYLENLFFPENFKECKDCGETLLLNNQNFMRRKQSKDGFSCRCKKCDKIKRLKYYGKEDS